MKQWATKIAGVNVLITALMKILNKKYLEAYSELRQTSKMERFAKIVNRFYQLNIPGIRSILDV